MKTISKLFSRTYFRLNVCLSGTCRWTMKQDALVTQFSPLQHGREPVKQNVTIDRGAVFASAQCQIVILHFKEWKLLWMLQYPLARQTKQRKWVSLLENLFVTSRWNRWEYSWALSKSVGQSVPYWFSRLLLYFGSEKCFKIWLEAFK